LLEEFHREKGRLPKSKEEYETVKIGSFLMNVKHGETSITTTQMERLKKLGFILEIRK